MLSIVATPIGNREDITLRALRILREADYIACEDTRHTGKLLAHHEIIGKGRLIAYSAQATVGRENEILELLKSGKHVALVSDAGTPLVSDPGERLLRRVYDQLPDINVETIPGPSAIPAALAIAGVSTARFTYLGFPPQKKGRKTFFEKLENIPETVIMYESPHRLVKSLTQIAEISGDRAVVVLRELTKIHESRIAGTGQEVLDHFLGNPDQVRGECVIIIDAV